MMRKVLVVEDEPKIANMERDFLEGAGFEPYVTDNGEEALKNLLYDLKLTDKTGE